MYPIHKNSYLQIATPVDPRIINRCVDKAMEMPTVDAFDSMPPFNRVTSHLPCIPIPNCDVTRRRQAFGRWALPKLRDELSSQDICIVKQAVTTLSDVVHDPERNYEAIKLRMPARMVDLLRSEEVEIRERTLMALNTMANLLDGKNAIAKNKNMLNNFEICMEDPDMCVRCKVFVLLETLTSVWMVADVLVDHGFVEKLINHLRKVYEQECPEILTVILQILYNLMYCNGKFLAIESGLYCLLLDVLDKQSAPEVIGWCLKCVSVLTQTDMGKEIALHHKLLKRLYGYLFSEIQVVYENAAAAMVLATIKTETLVKAIKLPNLVDRLIELAKGQHHPCTQKLCMQVLANLTGHGTIKKYLLVEKIEELEAIHVDSQDEHGQRIKEMLLVDSLKFG